MLQLIIPEQEFYDEVNEEFIYVREQTLSLEHSLVSISKWESKWCKPFIDNNEKTMEETLDYIRCMTITQNVDPKVYNCLSKENIEAVNEYIARPMTATWFAEDKAPRRNHETITAELIYYAMIANNIPFECQKWHINKLLTLIRVCNIKNSPPKKMSKAETLAKYREINAARLKKMNTRG